MKEFYLECRDLSFFVRTTGNSRNSPVVFLHGITMSGAVWECPMNYLEDEFYCIAIDFRGHGRSSKPTPIYIGTDGGNYSFETHCDDVHCILEKMGIKKPAIIGWSLGGLVAQVYAFRYATFLSSLVLVDTGPQGDSTPEFPWGIPTNQANQLIAYLKESTNTNKSNDYRNSEYSKFLDLLDSLNFTDKCKNINDPKIKRDYSILEAKLRQISLQASPNAILASFLQNGTRSLLAILPYIKVPTLIIVGSLDKFYPFQAARYMRENIPNSILVEFDSKGHSAFLTNIGKFDKILWSFLTETDKNCDICINIHP